LVLFFTIGAAGLVLGCANGLFLGLVVIHLSIHVFLDLAFGLIYLG